MKNLLIGLFVLGSLSAFAGTGKDLYGLDAFEKVDELSNKAKDVEFEHKHTKDEEGKVALLEWEVSGTVEGKRWSCNHAMPLKKKTKDQVLANYRAIIGVQANKMVVHNTFYYCREMN